MERKCPFLRLFLGIGIQCVWKRPFPLQTLPSFGSTLSNACARILIDSSTRVLTSVEVNNVANVFNCCDSNLSTRILTDETKLPSPSSFSAGRLRKSYDHTYAYDVYRDVLGPTHYPAWMHELFCLGNILNRKSILSFIQSSISP